MNLKFMNIALKEANKAYNKGEIPVGAVIVKNNKIIAKAYNKTESRKDCTMHAEILAIKKASKKLNNWRLIDCEMYVTLEPCKMCEAAISFSRIKKVYFGVKNKSIFLKANYKQLEEYEKKITIILKSFFKHQRK